MKKLMFAAAAVAACVAIADPAPLTKQGASAKHEEGEDAEIAWLRRTGGKLPKPDSAKGKIVFLDTCGAIVDADYNKVLEQFHKDDMNYVYALVRKQGIGGYPAVDPFSAAKKDVGADVLVMLYSDQDRPVLLAAPDEGWAAVNVAKIGKGLAAESAKAKFVPSRTRKAMMRALAYACGAGGTGFPGNILSIARIEDLDYCKEFIPFDAIQQIFKLLEVRGVTRQAYVTYRAACRQGWAPAPTNEYQKAVWDKVHELPTNPLPLVKPTK